MTPDRNTQKSLIRHDPLYGPICLEDALLQDLYFTQAVQRLALIYQAGVTAFIRPERNATRLDHSLGVLALLQRLGASVEEQAAGLLHDVPHTAFSHVIDFVFPNAEHSYHEVHREAVIAASDLPACVEGHGLDWRRITEPEHYSLLEQPLPALCADRLDYFLRDGLALGLVTYEAANALLENLGIMENRIVVTNLDTARWLGEAFIATDDAIWCSVQEVGWYAVMAEVLREALDVGAISADDFAGTDQALMMRLRALPDTGVKRWLSLLQRDVDFIRVDDDGDLAALPKVRAVDPPVAYKGNAVALSSLDLAFAHRRDTYLASKQGPWKLKIVPPKARR